MGTGLGSARDLDFHSEVTQQSGFLGENGNLIGLSQEVARLVTGLTNAFGKTSGSARRFERCRPLKTED